MNPHAHSEWVTRRVIVVLGLLNATLAVAAALATPTFGVSELDSALKGTTPAGVTQDTTRPKSFTATRALDRIAERVKEDPDVMTGWKPGYAGVGVETTPVELQCFARTSGNPVAARTQGWARGAVNSSGLASQSVMWSVRAYGASGGSRWMHQLRTQAGRCGVWLTSVPNLGTEAVTFLSGRNLVLVWREGDVVSSFGYQQGSRPGRLATLLPSAQAITAVIVDEIKDECANLSSTYAQDKNRSPYISGMKYHGLYRDRTFKVAANVLREPADWATTGGQQVKVEGAPSEVTLPAPPPGGQPALDLPEALGYPVMPTEPPKPGTTYDVNQQTRDLVGPGCGWAFTKQVPPTFDAALAAKAFTVSKAHAEARVKNSWTRWFSSMSQYKSAVKAYNESAAEYQDYATDVRFVAYVWDAVGDARAEYQDDLKDYTEQQDDLDDFLADQEEARQRYAEDQEFCSTGTVWDPSQAREEPTCPATAPDILSEEEPSVRAKPSPPDEARIISDLMDARERQANQ